MIIQDNDRLDNEESMQKQIISQDQISFSAICSMIRIVAGAIRRLFNGPTARTGASEIVS
jgi:hypothetical protein